MKRWVAILSLVAVACSTGPREPAPDALREYLSALQDGRLEEAYEMTQLEDLAGSPGAAVSVEHFVAAWDQAPLTGYEITEVIALRKRAIEDFGEGDPYFETRVQLTTASSSWVEEIGIDGEVTATVLAGAYPVTIEDVRRRAMIEVDGVAVDVGADPDGVVHLLVLGGRHELRVDDRRVVLDAEPLAIVDGDATVSDEAARRITVAAS